MGNLLSRRSPRLRGSARENKNYAPLPVEHSTSQILRSPPSHLIVPHPFPLELWEYIITFLRADGRSHVVLSAVSRTMRHLVLPYYFQSVAFSSRLSIERFLEAYEGLLPEECSVRDLFLTGSTYDEEDVRQADIRMRPLKYLPFSTLYHRLLQLLAPSLEHLTVTYPLYREFGHTHLLPPMSFPRMQAFVARAEAFNRHFDSNRQHSLPHIPSLKRMYLFGSNLEHGSFDILADVAPNLEQLRIDHLPQCQHYTLHVGTLLGMKRYTSLPYEPSKRRIDEVGTRLHHMHSPFGPAHWPSSTLSSDRELFSKRPALASLTNLFIGQMPPAELEEITNRYTGLAIQLTIYPFQEYDDHAAFADWQDTVLGGKGAWARSTTV